MKIGILTFHRSVNYGAVAQCYALAKRIQSDFPEDEVEVIDYVPQFRLDHYNVSLKNYLLGSVSDKNNKITNLKIVFSKVLDLIVNPQNFLLLRERKKAFIESMSFLPLSKEKYRQNDVDSFRREIYGKYDVIVVGSDCVWEWTTVSFPNAYYLCGDFGAKKMSFAASAGTDDFYLLDIQLQQALSAAINEFCYIGVRDTSTEYVVKQASPDTVYFHNCDPTTFLDVEQFEEYKLRVKRRLMDKGIDFSKPVIGIMGNDKLVELAKNVFSDSCNYIALYVPNKQCDVNLLDLSVPEWISVFGLFDLTFTTFFHGTMLSLAHKTPVLSFDYLPETESQITKLHELYNRLDLPGFYHRGKRKYDETDVAQIGEIAKNLLENPPKDKIEKELKAESQYYESFRAVLNKIHNGEEIVR